MLKTGAKLKCSNCGTEYKTNKVIGFVGSFYTWSGVSIFVLLIFTSILWNFFEKFFDKKFGTVIWLYAFIVLSVIEFIVTVILPLNKIENKN